jgi:hypothetical protein
MRNAHRTLTGAVFLLLHNVVATQREGARHGCHVPNLPMGKRIITLHTIHFSKSFYI